MNARGKASATVGLGLPFGSTLGALSLFSVASPG